ncbi:MAG: adenylate/guanylate cyclase domain-containing protein [Pyrinomonadaceae bacterium]
MNTIIKITEPNGRTWETSLVPGTTYTLGRARVNDIVLNDRRVSRKHAFLTSAEENFKIIDGYLDSGNVKRSVNRVFINGMPILEKTLEKGDIITIGESDLEVMSTAVLPHGVNPVEKREETTAPTIPTAEMIDTAESVAYDDAPLGHVQVLISADHLIGRPSYSSVESSAATPEELKELRRKAKTLDLLFEMSKMLGTVFDLKEMFEKATDLIFRGTPADRVVALLLEESSDGNAVGYSLVQIGARVRKEASGVISDKLTISRTITQKVIREKIALLSQDARTDEQFHGSESIVSLGVRSTICAPLITDAHVHGVVYADRLDPFSAFTPEHLELISAVAAQAAVTVENVKTHKRLAREEVARANFSRFMPEYVVKQMLDNPNSFRLGGATQEVTVLFADIRGFTMMSERENPEKIVGLLNRYFSAMSEVIFGHGGTLDKYIGDGLMAIFGAPTATADDALNAVKAAIAMQKKLVGLNSDLEAEGYESVSVGIGLHTGMATIGYIGSEKRSEYTAIGDTVNLASRLESNAVGGQILISEATASACGGSLPLATREALVVKNRVQPVNLFEVVWN